MIKKRKIILKKFGKYLLEARRGANISSQKEAAEKVTKRLWWRVSQSLIAQYELGVISDPNYRVLQVLSQVYQKSYTEMVFSLVVDKYGLDKSSLVKLLEENMLQITKPTNLEQNLLNLFVNYMLQLKKIYIKNSRKDQIEVISKIEELISTYEK